MIEGPSGWLSVLCDDSVLNDYDVDERAALATMLAEPVPFLVEWKGADLLKALVQAVPEEIGAVVDNDHGVMVPVREVRDLPIESWVKASKLP
jgi:hypothetical protein